MVADVPVLCRLGVKTRAFHLGDYRRAHMGPGKDVPHDYFFVNGRLYWQALLAGSSGSLYWQSLLAGSTGSLYRQALD